MFDLCREAILRTAKTLVEDTKNLVSSAQASQDVLASAAQSAVGSVSKLADNVKLGALALGPDDSDAQVNINQSLIDISSGLFTCFVTDHFLFSLWEDVEVLLDLELQIDRVTSVLCLMRYFKVLVIITSRRSDEAPS